MMRAHTAGHDVTCHIIYRQGGIMGTLEHLAVDPLWIEPHITCSWCVFVCLFIFTCYCLPWLLIIHWVFYPFPLEAPIRSLPQPLISW